MTSAAHQYITDFLEAMQHWHESQTALATDESLHSMVKIMRMVLFEKNTFRMALSTQENAALYLDFSPLRRPGAEFMVTHPMVEQTKYGEQSDHLSRRSTLIVGLQSYLCPHPDVEDEVLIDVVTACSTSSRPREARGSLIRGSALLLVEGRRSCQVALALFAAGSCVSRRCAAYGESLPICAPRRLSAIILP